MNELQLRSRFCSWLAIGSCALAACSAPAATEVGSLTDEKADPAETSAAPPVVTTLVQTLQPAHGWGSYLRKGRAIAPPQEFGALHPDEGEPHQLRSQLALPDGSGAEDLLPGALPETSRSALYAFLIADAQLVDQDSPAQIARNAASPLRLSSFRPAGELAPHLFDALVRTANAYQDARPFDVVCLLGDSVENAQANELDWFLTILHGGVLTADSGERDDVVAGPSNDAYDPFVAEGLRAGTPWINVLGNHDVNINGGFPPRLIEALEGDEAARELLAEVLRADDFTIAAYPTSRRHPAVYPHGERPTFAVARDAFEPHMLPYAHDSLDHLRAGTVMADRGREPLDAGRYIAAHWATGGDPVGHGFPAESIGDGTGWYTYDPLPGLPLRVIALSLGRNDGGIGGVIARPSVNGELDPARVGDPRHDQIAFLEQELLRAADEGVGVFVISHHASDAIATKPALRDLPERVNEVPGLRALWSEHIGAPVQALDTEQLRRMLAGSGQVIAHLAGHHHVHRVRAICPDTSKLGPDNGVCAPGEAGQTGYWEIVTSAVVAFPHQGRFLELVQVQGRLAALYLTVLDPHVQDGSLLELGRFIARAWLAVRDGGAGGAGEVSDRNLLLPVWLPERVADRLEASDLPARIESETTLHDELPALPPLPVWPIGLRDTDSSRE